MSISKELKEKFRLIKNIDFANILSDDVEYQKLTLRNMTISEKDIRSRAYEAHDLKGLLSLHSAGRSIPSYIKIKEGNKKISLSSVGRIIEDSERIDINSLVFWAKSKIDLLNNKNLKNSFISNFARSVDLNDILKNNKSKPVSILLEYHLIFEYIESVEDKIYKIKNGKYIEVTGRIRRIISNLMEKVYDLDLNGCCTSNTYRSWKSKTLCKDKLRTNKSGFSIQARALKLYYICKDGNYISIQELINKNKFFSVIFDNPSYMYFMGCCFQNNSNISEISNILDSMEAFDEINNVTSEKGEIKINSKNFESNSLFYLIEKIHAKKKDKYIFCDDLGDEWADHITINEKENSISFIHSKHKDTSNSASNLHDVVGQAIKNLGNIRFSKEQFLRKKKTLDGFYSRSKIHKVRRGNLDKLEADLDKVLKQHSLHRKCIIACSFLSKKSLEGEFNKLVSNNKYVRGNIVQLIWILSSFIHAAKESGVIPIIYCRP
ncbi:hypothetical protein CH637_004315 [Haemophilus influenzae]|uniref:hypothetical protein n=1 Tax=Haemophilus influenzae TaxID=727 RepID=UPI0011B24CAB|nr:hypothetical protein [Haemophilus influenzae]MCK9683505.1 hypothetical protein [Haemophilus influenzae]